MPPEKHYEMRGAVRAIPGRASRRVATSSSAKSLAPAPRRRRYPQRRRRERVEVSAPVPGADGLPIEGLGSEYRLRSRERLSAARRSLTELSTSAWTMRTVAH